MAFGLFQLLSSLGSGPAPDGVNAPIGLNQLLRQYGLPPNPLKKAMQARMDREARLWVTRPLEPMVLQYAGGCMIRREVAQGLQCAGGWWL